MGRGNAEGEQVVRKLVCTWRTEDQMCWRGAPFRKAASHRICVPDLLPQVVGRMIGHKTRVPSGLEVVGPPPNRRASRESACAICR